ncbi:MAG: ParA family protein [Phycisphaerales bacterium]|nr:ParA family protein [Phycisphaerales bacterium]
MPQRVIALMNQKGGVGKTTTTVNLAAGIARLGRRVLVVDLDPQAHATLALGLDPSEISGSMYDLLIDPSLDPNQVVREVKPGLWLLRAETDLAAVESELAGAPDRHGRLAKVLARLGDAYEFVLLDCPPALGLLTVSALVAAREVLVPMQAQFLALQGVGKLLETVGLVAREVNPRLRVAGVVLCMFDGQTTHTQEVLADLESFFTEARKSQTPWQFARVYRPPVRRNIKLAECPSFGQTIFEYAPDAAGAKDYAALAESVVSEWDSRHASPGASGAPDSAPAQPEVVVTASQVPGAQVRSEG